MDYFKYYNVSFNESLSLFKVIDFKLVIEVFCFF